MRRRLPLILSLLACALAVAPAAYASWTYATQTSDGASYASRAASHGCSVKADGNAVRLACSRYGSAVATYTFQLPSNVAGKPSVGLVPLLGHYRTYLKVKGSTATVTVKVTRGTYTLKWVNLLYYVR